MAWLRALALIGLGLGALVWLIPAAPMSGDGQHYIEFVRNNLQHGASSWHERRLLGPLIVRALPLDAQDGFFVLTVASLAATALLTWRAARAFVTTPRALLGIGFLLGTWVVAPNLREYGLIDPLAWAFVAAVWLATVHQRWWLAALLAAIGVVAKEILVLAAVAAAAAAAWEGAPLAGRKSHFRPLRAAGVAAPAVATAIALTLLFPGSGSDAIGYLLKWVRDGLGSLGPARVLFYIFSSYAALWLLVPRGFIGLPPHLRRAAVVYAAAVPLLPLVGSPERMEEAVFPAVLACAVLATRDVAWPLACALAVGNLVFVARIGGDARIPTLVAWAGLALACGLVAWIYARARLRAPTASPSRYHGSVAVISTSTSSPASGLGSEK